MIQQIPDWNLYPWPEVFYEKYNLPKPKARDSAIEEMVLYKPSPYIPLGDGKTEVRGPAEGGVRIIEEYQTLPVEMSLIKDEQMEEKKEDVITGQEVQKSMDEILERIRASQSRVRISFDTPPGSQKNSLNPPTEHNTTETLRV